MSSGANVDELLKRHVSWLADGGEDGDIAMSSRIRLARNIEGIPFPTAATVEQLKQSGQVVATAIEETKCLGPYPMCFMMDNISDFDRRFLFERRLISNEFMNKTDGAMLYTRRDESAGIMINEEDHLRLQVMRPGFQLEKAWRAANRIDRKLEKKLPMVFDDKLGYLTSCPTNVGTGIRASVMLHLPGLVLSGQINAATQGISKLGLAVRGIFGEGTENTGNLFQVSNQSTLGESETQIIERLSGVIRQLICHEKNTRISMLEKDQYFLMDHVGRAYGILRHAYLLNSEEALNSLSGIRIGVDMGMFSAVDQHIVNELLVVINPAHLQKFAKSRLDSKERDIFRAMLVRERLKSVSNA